MHLTLAAYLQGVQSGKLVPEQVVSHYLKKAQDKNDDLFAFMRFHEEYVKDHMKAFSSLPLHGAPIGIKDILLTQGYISSCGSKMLEHFVSPYSATCFLKLENQGGLMIGKTNMDEFAMGSSTETSAFGNTINPYGTNRVPGGSSGGSAAAVAADLCMSALGTDTGGSIRQPAALCGVVGLKPTYGRVSRYGVQAMASSFDQVGVLTKTVEDSEILLKAIAGYDPQDAQSDVRADDLDFTIPSFSLQGCKIALPKQCLGEGLDPKIKEKVFELVDKLKKAGASVDEVDLPVLTDAIAIYYSLMPAEVSTNLARYDGIKYGLQKDTMKYDSLMEYYKAVRSEGFGDEVKRRILLGTFVLSSANYEGYYLKAQHAREATKKAFETVFENYDVILTPTSPEVARKIGEKSDDPLKMYLADIYTVPANIAGIPAISVPFGMVEDRGEMLPVGMQLMAKRWNEKILFAMGKEIEKMLK